LLKDSKINLSDEQKKYSMPSTEKRKNYKYSGKKQGFAKPKTIDKKINKLPVELAAEGEIKHASTGKASVKNKKVTTSVKKTSGIGKAAIDIEKTAPAIETSTAGIGGTAIVPKKTLPPAPEKTSVPSLKHRHNKLWIILPVVFAVIALGVLAGLYYYALYFNKPNFEVNDYNKILQNTSAPVRPGQEIQYSIEFKNTGNTDITELSIETEIPANTSIVSSSSNSRVSADSKKITFFIAGLAKGLDGKVNFSVKVKSPLDDDTKIKSGKTVFNYISREKQKQFQLTDSVESMVTSSPDFSNFTLSFKDITSENIGMGDDILFTLTLGNTGDMDAAGVRLSNILPDKFILNEDSLQPAAIFNKDTGEIVWDIAKIKTGEVMDFSFKAKVGENFGNLETFKDIASITYKNISAKEISAEGKVIGRPSFITSTNTVEHPASSAIWAGDILKYTVNVINSGFSAGEDIELICPIPDGTAYVKNSGSHTEYMEFDQENNILRWKIKTIDVNETLGFSFETRIASSLTRGGTIKSAFYIKGGDKDYNITATSINVKSYIFQTIVCMGDSQIVKSNWPAYLDGALEATYPHAEYNTIGSGVPQQMAYQGVRRFDGTIAVYHPQIVVIGYGTNDVGSGTSLFAAGIQDLIDKAKGIGATVIFHSIGYIDTDIHPAKKGWQSYNDAMQEVCANNGVPYVDIAGPMSEDPGLYVSSDGMHWTDEGGQLVAHLVFNTIRNYLDGEGKRK
jgi:uncharacterized repeat protein (TIGR01451 family)